jgi:hypothetical protein
MPLGLEAAQAVGVELPAGDYVHAGKYFPVLVTLQESGQGGRAEIQVGIDSLKFSRQVSMSAGAVRRLLIHVVAFSEHPEIVIEVRSEGRRWRYPQLAAILMDRLQVLPGREHLVGIIYTSSDHELSRIFKRAGIISVQVKPRQEFPQEVLECFDLIAFEGSLWNTMDQSLREAIKIYIESGGKVFISGQEQIPIHVSEPAGQGVLLSSQLGMGTIFVPNRTGNLHTSLFGTPETRERILRALGLSEPRKTTGCSPSEVAQAFEPLPRYVGMSVSWALYLIICSMTICGVGLCSLLRLWSRNNGIIIMPVLAIGLSAGFTLFTPSGNVAYERITLFVNSAGSEVALRQSYVQLYTFSASGNEQYELGANGLTVPAKSGWGGCSSSSLVFKNGDNASVSGLCLEKGDAAVFMVKNLVNLDGGFYAAKRNGQIRFTNNSGFDLNDCILVRSGRITELGQIPFGQTVSLNPRTDTFTEDYIRSRFGAKSRKERTLATFTEFCMKKCIKPETTYVVGWAEDGAVPSGYAQAETYGAMWIVEAEDEH